MATSPPDPPAATDPVVALADQVGELWAERGGTRMSGRVFGYLLFTGAAATSARHLQAALGASAGAVSGAIRYLMAVGLARTVPGAGRRETYYAVSPDPFAADLDRARKQLGRWREIADLATATLKSTTGEGSHPGVERAQATTRYIAALDSRLQLVAAELAPFRR